jgi:outer membrane protein OmpA-like peptidoglycan-associated protein
MIRQYYIGMCLVVFLAGCVQHRTTVVLVPDPQGHVGTVAVQTQGGEQLLSKSGEAVIVENKQDVPSPATQFGEDKIRAIFGKALDAEPPVPEKFILYFKIDSTEMLPGSKSLIPKIIESIHQRSSFDISINGHADRVGTEEYNFVLSIKRADYIEDLLIKAGIDKHNITTAFHGEGDPVIPTPDGVAEPRNRRVEVIVR